MGSAWAQATLRMRHLGYRQRGQNWKCRSWMLPSQAFIFWPWAIWIHLTSPIFAPAAFPWELKLGAIADCLEHVPQVIFVPCGHALHCRRCHDLWCKASQVSGAVTCPMCRSKVARTENLERSE
ncbi:hypothetical protein WJX84_002085 [Apatococcus fuscideae]|uniref:RING-type domain-containing protein n=1 Tax=Apatococcus fuscideae TaxID=2026836 RepID=A0AAW1TCE4_9CHLO